MAAPHLISNGGAGRRPQLPAFCRTRRPTTVAVTDNCLTALRLLVLVGLLFQLSTLLLVISGLLPARLEAVSNHSPLPPTAGVADRDARPIAQTSDR
jgi:hypothetical protein